MQRSTIIEEKGHPARRISRVVLEVCKYVSYMRIEYSDGSEAFTVGRSAQEPQYSGSARNYDDYDYPAYSHSPYSSSYSSFSALSSARDTAASANTAVGRRQEYPQQHPQQQQQHHPRPELSSSYKYRLLLQQQQRLGSSGGRVEIEYVLLRETLTLESSEVIVDVWGHLLPGTTHVSSIAFYTSRERVFGPYGITEGERFDLAAPDGGCYLYALRASAKKRKEGPVLCGLFPTWCRAAGGRVAVAARRIREIGAFQEAVAAFVSHSVDGTEPGERLRAELRLDARQREREQEQRRRGGSGRSREGAEPWPVTCFALVDEADLMVDDLRANYPRLAAEDADVVQGLAKIAAFSRSLRDIARGYAVSAIISRTHQAPPPLLSPSSSSPSLSLASSLAASSSSSSSSSVNGVSPSAATTSATTSATPRDVPKASFYLIPEGARKSALAVERSLCIPGARLVVAPFRHGDPGQLFAFTREGLVVHQDSGMAVCAAVDLGHPFVPGAVAVLDEPATETSRGMDMDHVVANFVRQSFMYSTQDHTFRIGGSGGNQLLCLALGPAVPDAQDGQRFVVLAPHTGELGQRWLFKR